ncbi:MAG: 2-phosphosulfolactate phosphatase [Planctomycetes bacterium]|nr:2-phosphosulfolactate phosphatase [Planctomycetota bacterium]
MKIELKYGIDDAPHCEGYVVVIDVIRAFTTAAFAFYRGAEKIFLVSTAEEAFRLKAKNPRFVLVGENGGRQIEGFDFGNSPEAISREDFTGRSIVLRSSSGTQGVVSAKRAEQIYLGSLVVASATARALRLANPRTTTILAMGSVAGPDGAEDIACRTYIDHVLREEAIDKQRIIDEVRNSPSGLQALDPLIDYKTPGDLDCATCIDRFDFTMPVTREGSYLIARRKGAKE